MLVVPVAAVPNQTLNVTLDGQAVSLAIYTLNTPSQSYMLGTKANPKASSLKLYMDVYYQNATIRSCVQCVNLDRILSNTQYTPFVGDFVWVDRQGSSDPLWSGLGTRWQLVYLEASDLG